MKRVCIFGESPLLEEYALQCLARGLDVQVRPNTDSGRGNSISLPRKAKKVQRPSRSSDLALELTNTSLEIKRRNLEELDRVLPPQGTILSSSVTTTVAEQGSWIRRPERLVGIGAFPSFLEGSLIELASSRITDAKSLQAAAEFVTVLGKESTVVGDSAGMVLPRIVCMIVNEAYFAMTEGVAPARDIDTAMRLGTNYPHGPVEWGDRIGAGHVRAVLDALYRHYGEDRYRIAPLLLRTCHEGSV